MDGSRLYSLLLIVIVGSVAQVSSYEVVFALNAGGRSFIDSNDIEYQEDTAREGYNSNHGVRYSINRVPPEDAIIYQTERYSTKSFSYTIPLEGEGKYLLVLKFCEVFFEEANKKVFDVLLNDGAHSVVTDLDIFQKVGHATAHDEYIPFTVSRGKLFIKDGVSEIRNGRLKITFVKSEYDNPKINAIVLVKGADVQDFPRLPPFKLSPHKNKKIESTKDIPNNAEDDDGDLFESLTNSLPVLEKSDHHDEEEDDVVVTDRRERKTSGPRQPDPYESDNSSVITITFILVATVIPIVILRCKV